ncbi:MAG TPA: LEA type 2 family protein [Gemmatimonadaceae bacterium]
MRPLLHSFTAVALVATLGCGSSGPSPEPVPFEQPVVALRHVRLRGVGLRGGALEVEMGVYNPNDYDLVSPRVHYRVYVGDAEVASGLTDLNVVLPSRDSTVVRIPASVGYGAMRRAGRELLGTGAAPYRVLGRITVGTPYGRLSFPYDRAGQFSPMSARR